MLRKQEAASGPSLSRDRGWAQKWAKRPRITKRSFNLFMEAMMVQQEQRVSSMRRKADKARLEEWSTLAALVADVCTELQAWIAINLDKIHQAFTCPIHQ